MSAEQRGAFLASATGRFQERTQKALAVAKIGATVAIEEVTITGKASTEVENVPEMTIVGDDPALVRRAEANGLSVEGQRFYENTPGVIQSQDLRGFGKGLVNSPAATVEGVSSLVGVDVDLSVLKVEVAPNEESGALIGEGVGPGPFAVARGVGKGAKLLSRALQPRIVDPAFRLAEAEVDATALAARFEEEFGKKPEAIFLVGSRAEKALGDATIDVSKSDIDVFIQTDIADLSKFEGQGFKFFKELNPGKVPPGTTGVGFGPGRVPIGSGPGTIPKADLIDPFFGPKGGLIPGNPAVQVF
jgi:hypothetical protein